MILATSRATATVSPFLPLAGRVREGVHTTCYALFAENIAVGQGFRRILPLRLPSTPPSPQEERAIERVAGSARTTSAARARSARSRRAP